MEKTYQDDDEIEIDLIGLFLALKKKLWLIVLMTILGGGATGAYSYFVIPPTYESTSMMYVLSKETTLASLADLQIGSQLTADYQVMITSRPVMEEVIENLGLNLTYKELKEKLSINNPSNTRIISLTIEDGDPVRAKTIVDEVATVSSNYIGDIMELVPPKLIETGVIPIEKSSPNHKKNTLIGALVGAMLVSGIVVLKTILNDSIKSEDDVERRLGLTVLAVVPAFDDADKTKPVTKPGERRKRGKYNGK